MYLLYASNEVLILRINFVIVICHQSTSVVPIAALNVQRVICVHKSFFRDLIPHRSSSIQNGVVGLD